MKNMVEVKKNRMRVSTFIDVSVAMMICMHFFMLFLDWLQFTILPSGNGTEIVMDICRLFGCFLIIVAFAKYVCIKTCRK